MARQPSLKTVVSRLFDDSSLPIYLLDGSRKIVYANRTLAEWVASNPEDLIGKRCSFTATREVDASDVCNQLCPPPQAWHDPIEHQLLVIHVGGQTRRRLASYFPLAEDVSAAAMLVVLAGSEADDLGDDSLQPSDLHRQIVELREATQSRYSVDRLIGKSPALRQVRNQITVAANSPSCRVLVVGNEGTGRETVARTVHHERLHSKAAPLIALSCSLLDATLLQTTIDAILNQPDEDVGRSTLLLLDVDRLDAAAQLTLAKFVATPTFDLPTIATARVRLLDLVALGEFREDLGYDLVSVEISLPSLRERMEDVPLIAQWLVEELNSAGQTQIGGFTTEAMDMLISHRWQRDVAELTEYVRQAFQIATGPLIDVDDLPRKIQLTADAESAPPLVHESIKLDEFLSEVETELIRRALQSAKGNKAKAARTLGISRARILRRMEQLGIE